MNTLFVKKFFSKIGIITRIDSGSCFYLPEKLIPEILIENFRFGVPVSPQAILD
jgi:hypothetical protein